MSRESKFSVKEICAFFGLILAIESALCGGFWCIVDSWKCDLKEDIAVVSLQVDNLDTKFEDHLKYHEKDTCDEVAEIKNISYAKKD